MSRLVAVEYMSLDGVIQGPGHAAEDQDGGFAHGGWTAPFTADHARYNSESFQAAGSFLLGRRTYEIWAEYWPTVTDRDEIARALNTKPKYVASTTLNRANWQGTTILKGGLPGEIEALKRDPGKPILMIGSSDLAQTLIEHDLVDEYQLWLHPVMLGGGKRLFRDGNPAGRLKLIDSRTTGSGLVILTYERAG
jgi:dihydrofolate reductase